MGPGTCLISPVCVGVGGQSHMNTDRADYRGAEGEKGNLRNDHPVCSVTAEDRGWGPGPGPGKPYKSTSRFTALDAGDDAWQKGDPQESEKGTTSL